VSWLTSRMAVVIIVKVCVSEGGFACRVEVYVCGHDVSSFGATIGNKLFMVEIAREVWS
jgi:hypothetical protein